MSTTDPLQGQLEAQRPSFVSSALVTYGTNIAVALLSLVNVLIIARVLGPTGRGGVAFLTTVAFLSSQLATLGIQQANVNFAARDPRLQASLATNSLLFALVAGAGAMAIVAGLVAVFPVVAGDSDTGLRWLALASIPMLIFGVYLQNLAIANYSFRIQNAAWLLGPLTNVAANSVLAAAGALTVGRALAVWIIGQGLSMLLLLWFTSHRLSGFGRPDRALARRMLSFGLKAHAGRVFTLGNYRLDQWIMGALSTQRQLGLYSVAVAWSEALFFLPTALSIVQRPDLVRASRSEAGRLAATVFRAAILITSLLMILLIVLAPMLILFLFGDDFRDSIDQLRILALGAFGIVALKLLGTTLTAQGKPLLETAAVGCAFVCIVVLDLVLIPAHGGLGAAIASAVSYTVGGLAAVVVFARALKLDIGRLKPGGGDLRWLWRRLRPSG
jgi:O-antigen/teichoic acid export membrane protein